MWISTLLDWLFFSFYQTGRRGQCFIAPFTSWTNFAQFFFKPEVCKSYVWLFCTVWALVQCLTVLWYVQWRVQPCLQWSIVISSWFFACHICTICETSTVYIFIWMWPQIKVSRVLGDVEHSEALFDIYLTKLCDFKCFKVVYSLYSIYCSHNKYCF